MLVFLNYLCNLAVVGSNSDKQLGLSSTSQLNAFQVIQSNHTKYDKVSLGQSAGYIISQGSTYITGKGFTFENKSIPSSPFAESPYLKNFNIVDVCVSTQHAIALDSNGNVHTMGDNSQNQLARQNAQSNTAGQATLPTWNEPILQVGAVKSLSYIVYKSAVFVIGKCESCLCGNSQSGSSISGKQSQWIQLNTSSIANMSIKRAYFGQSQFVLQMTDNRFYYIGKTKFHSGCQAKESFCTPGELPFTDAKAIFLSQNVTAIVKLNNEIHYCGCMDPKACTDNAVLLKFNYTHTSGSIVHKVVQLNTYWYIVESQVVQRCSSVGGSFLCNRQTISNNNTAMSAIVGYENSAIAFPLYRHLNLKLLGSQNANISLCGTQLQQQQIPYNHSLDLVYSTFAYGAFCTIDITGDNIHRIVDNVELLDTNVTLEYNVRQLPYVGAQTFNIYLKFTSSGQPIHDSFDVKIVSISQNNSTILTQQSVNQWTVLQLSLQNTGLYDTYNISVITPSGQTKKYEDVHLVHQVTQPDENITVQMTKIEEMYFSVVEQSSQTPIAGETIQFYYEKYPNHTFRNNETTNSTGHIKLTRLPTDPNQNGFNLLYKYDGNGQYQSRNFTYQWITFDASTQRIELQVSGAHLIISVTYGRSGTVELVSDTNVSLVNVTFPTNNLLQPYQKSVKIDSSWGQIGKQVTGRYTDPSGTYFAPEITHTLQDGVQYQFQVQQAIITAKFRLLDQYNQRVPNHVLTVSTDNKVTSTNYTSNGFGNLNVSINLTNLTNGEVWVWADKSGDYEAYPEKAFPATSLTQRQELVLYKYITFNITLQVFDGITGDPVSGMEIQIANSATPDTILLNNITDQAGTAEFIVSEKLGVIQLRQNYIITITDPTGQLAQNTKSIYITTALNEIDVRMNANKLTFQLLDNITNQAAQGASIKLKIGQQTTNAVSDIDGMVVVDVTGTFTQSQLHYKVFNSDIYKPTAWNRFRYSRTTIPLNVQSWLNMTLQLLIVDGKSNDTLDNMNVSIYTDAGDLRYNQMTTQTGHLWLNFSERDGLLNISTVYNLSIDDTLGRYKLFNVNYSFSATDEYTLVPMDLQMLLIIVTNFDAERIPNVSIDLFVDGELLKTQISNQLGIALFYLQQFDFLGKQLTYYVHQSDAYRPKGPLRIQIKQQPQNVIRRVFPLVIYNFTFNLTEKQNESTVINLNKQLYQYDNEDNYDYDDEAYDLEYTELDYFHQYNQNQFEQLNKKSRQRGFIRTNSNSDLPDIQIFNFSVIFYNDGGNMIFNTTIEDIYDPVSLIFVENINQTFFNNHRYKFQIIDNTQTYFPISGKFKNVLLERKFDYELRRMPPQPFMLPWWAYLFILCGILAFSFLIYAIKRLVGMKRTFRVVQEGKGMLLSNQRYFTEEQLYIKKETDNLNPLRSKSEQSGHVLVRKQLQNDTLNAYAEMNVGENNIIQSAQMLLKAKLQPVNLIH